MPDSEIGWGQVKDIQSHAPQLFQSRQTLFNSSMEFEKSYVEFFRKHWFLKNRSSFVSCFANTCRKKKRKTTS